MAKHYLEHVPTPEWSNNAFPPFIFNTRQKNMGKQGIYTFLLIFLGFPEMWLPQISGFPYR